MKEKRNQERGLPCFAIVETDFARRDGPIRVRFGKVRKIHGLDSLFHKDDLLADGVQNRLNESIVFDNSAQVRLANAIAAIANIKCNLCIAGRVPYLHYSRMSAL
jgi:hypothetical protein